MSIITRELWAEGPNGRLFGELYLPEVSGPASAGAEVPLGCVICSHGFTGTHAAPARYGRDLVEAIPGWAAYAFDFFGGSDLGRSGGHVTDHSILTEKADLLAVIDLIRALPEIDADRIVLEGHSQGGLVSALAAAERPEDVAGLMLLYPAFMIPDAVKQMVPSRDEIPERGEALGVEIGRIYVEDAWDVDAYGAAAAYPGPALVIQGTDDGIVSPEVARRAAGLYRRGELVELAGEGHGFSAAGQRRALDAMADFLARTPSDVDASRYSP